VVPPGEGVPPGPHRWHELKLTLWRYIDPVASGTPDRAETAAAIKLVHEALAEFEEPLPAFTLELEDATRFLQVDRSPALKLADRRFLSGVVDDVRAALVTVNEGWRPLRGSPHDGNWLQRANGPLLLDFETACCGAG
jgi:hypothetical protein